MVRRRLRLLAALLIAPFIVLISRLWHLQVDVESHSRYLFRAYDQYTENILVPPERGRLLDREGRVLAENRADFHLEFRFAGLEDRPRKEGIRAICAEISRWQEFPSEEDVERHLLSRISPELYVYPSASGAPEEITLVADVPGVAAARLDRRLGRNRAFVVRESDGGGWEVRVVPREAVRRELVIRRLVRLLSPRVSYRELDDRIESWLEDAEKEVAREVARFRARGVRDEAHVRRKERDVRSRIYRRRALLVSGVSLDTIAAIEYRPDDFPGISVRDASDRRYPLGEAAGALVGYLRKLGERDLRKLREDGRLLDVSQRMSAERFEFSRRRALSRDDLIGSTGLEARYDSRLRGIYGLRIARKDSHGRLLDDDLARVFRVNGRDVRTTIDATLQALLYDELRKACGPPWACKGGSVVVMDLASGALRASAGYPSYDPNRRREPGYRAELDRRFGEDGGWELDRPYQQAIFPGSVFKLVTALAGLEDGRDWRGRPDVSRRYECGGVYRFSRFFRCHSPNGHGVGDLDIVEALQYSCNNYFYRVAHKHLEPRELYEWAGHLGYGRAPGVDLPPSRLARGRLDPPEEVRGSRICHYAIGQYFVQATPMQVLRSVAAIALRGRALPRPHFVDRRPPEGLPAVKEEHIDAIWKGMVEAVRNPAATAGNPEYGLRRFSIALKTGTAEFTTQKFYHAWLGGFGPLPEPRFAFVINLESSPHYGGRTCAPVAKRLLEYLADENPDLLVDPP